MSSERTETNEVVESNTASGGLSRRRVLQATGASALGATVLVGSAGATTEECDDCVYLGKADQTPSVGDEYTFEHDGQTVTIKVEDTVKEDGEVVCAKLRVYGGELCKVVIAGGGPGDGPVGPSDDTGPPEHANNDNEKGKANGQAEEEEDEETDGPEKGRGPKTRVRDESTNDKFGSGVKSIYPCAPDHEQNPNRDYYEISHISFYLCIRD